MERAEWFVTLVHMIVSESGALLAGSVGRGVVRGWCLFGGRGRLVRMILEWDRRVEPMTRCEWCEG